MDDNNNNIKLRNIFIIRQNDRHKYLDQQEPIKLELFINWVERVRKI